MSEKFEIKAATSTNLSLAEDFQWLQALKDSSRHTSLGPKNMKIAKMMKRKISDRSKKKKENVMEKGLSVEIHITDKEESQNEN